MSTENQPNPPVPPVPPAPPVPPPANGAPPADPNLIALPKDQFDRRLEQAKRSATKELFGDADPAKELQELKELREAKAKADREALGEKARVEADLKAAAEARAKSDSEAAAAKGEAAQARFEADVARACARLGISNYDYALFLVGKQRSTEGFDVTKSMEALAADAAHKGALGIGAAAPVTTTPAGGPPPPPAPNPENKPIAMLDSEAWAKEKAKFGL